MKLSDLNKLLNSELTTKVKKSFIENDELQININPNDLNSVILYLKTDNKCKFRQLIDIVAADYPNEEKRFKICYLLLSHENNLRIKIYLEFDINEKIPSITKIYPSSNWMEREV